MGRKALARHLHMRLSSCVSPFKTAKVAREASPLQIRFSFPEQLGKWGWEALLPRGIITHRCLPSPGVLLCSSPGFPPFHHLFISKKPSNLYFFRSMAVSLPPVRSAVPLANSKGEQRSPGAGREVRIQQAALPSNGRKKERGSISLRQH